MIDVGRGLSSPLDPAAVQGDLAMQLRAGLLNAKGEMEDAQTLGNQLQWHRSGATTDARKGSRSIFHLSNPRLVGKQGGYHFWPEANEHPEEGLFYRLFRFLFSATHWKESS
jgi:hypothetical protein